MSAVNVAAYVIQAVFCLAGLVVLARENRRHANWTPPSGSRVLPWGISGTNFYIIGVMVVIGFLLPPSVIGALVGFDVRTDGKTALALLGATAFLGIIAACALAALLVPGARDPIAPPPRRGWRNIFGLGCLVFLAAMPVVMSGSLLWQLVLKAVGIPIVPQDLVGVFADARSPEVLIALLLVVVVLAPIAEETVFRAGLFRFARTRLPRWAGVVFPAVIFGAVHGYIGAFVPLTLLAIVYSLAFERTADIRVPIVAHALFNLNSTLLVLIGVNAP